MSARKWKFVSLMQGDKPLEADTFEQAWGYMAAWVKSKIATEPLSIQVLETAIWLETPHGSPMFFNIARDMAHDKGLICK